MKHIKIIKLNRKIQHKDMLIKNLFLSLIIASQKKNGIITTSIKAKMLKSFGNSLLNKLIDKRLIHIRFLNSFIADKNIIKYILNIVSNKERGFNFITFNKYKIRKGDSALLVKINLLY